MSQDLSSLPGRTDAGQATRPGCDPTKERRYCNLLEKLIEWSLITTSSTCDLSELGYAAAIL
jgi:hypothetical protein